MYQHNGTTIIISHTNTLPEYLWKTIKLSAARLQTIYYTLNNLCYYCFFIFFAFLYSCVFTVPWTPTHY